MSRKHGKIGPLALVGSMRSEFPLSSKYVLVFEYLFKEM